MTKSQNKKVKACLDQIRDRMLPGMNEPELASEIVKLSRNWAALVRAMSSIQHALATELLATAER